MTSIKFCMCTPHYLNWHICAAQRIGTSGRVFISIYACTLKHVFQTTLFHWVEKLLASWRRQPQSWTKVLSSAGKKDPKERSTVRHTMVHNGDMKDAFSETSRHAWANIVPKKCHALVTESYLRICSTKKEHSSHNFLEMWKLKGQ